MDEFNELIELLEAATNACDFFIKSEIALNDGNVEDSQKFSKNGQILVRALIKDTFEEIKEDFDINDEKTNDYDYPNIMELIKSFNNISACVASYIASIKDENIKNILKTKIILANNTTKEIYQSLFEN